MTRHNAHELIEVRTQSRVEMNVLCSLIRLKTGFELALEETVLETTPSNHPLNRGDNPVPSN